MTHSLTGRLLQSICLASGIIQLMTLSARAGEATMENNNATMMETPVSRSTSASYESSVTWGRDSNFNQSTTLTPGWMLNATAIGNLVNVRVSGAGNTVMVNAMQVNNGSQNANIAVGRTSLQANNNQSSTSVTQVQGSTDTSAASSNPAIGTTLSSTKSQ